MSLAEAPISQACIPWNREQAEEKLAQLEDSLVDLRPVLERFPVNHIHWRQGGAPLLFRLVPEALREGMLPFSDSIFNLSFETFLRLQGLPGYVSLGIYYPEENSVGSIKSALRFRELDFRFPIRKVYGSNGEEEAIDSKIAISTTHIQGTKSISHVFSDIQQRNFDYRVYERGQHFINTMLAAREYPYL